MKTILRYAMASIMAFFLCSCSKEAVKSISLNDPSIIDGVLLLQVGSIHVTLVDVYPAEKEDYLNWTSSNEGVATVFGGYVLAVAPGIATISASSVNGKSISFDVYVSRLDVKDWTAAPSVVMAPGSGAEVDVTVKIPEGASVVNLIPEIQDDPKGCFSATYTEHGFYVSCSQDAPADGSYKAKLKLSNVEGSKSTLTTLQALYIKPTGVSTSPSSVSELMIGETVDISAYVSPSNASIKDIEWSAEPAGVVSLTPNGSKCTVAGLAPGTVTVRATAVDGGKSASCSVHVVEPYAKSLSAHLESSYPLCVGGKTESSAERKISYTVSPSFIPVTITNQTPDIFDVEGDVVKNAKKAGTGTVKVSGGGKEVVLTINVVGPNSTFALGTQVFVSNEGYYTTYRYQPATSLDVLPARYTYLYTIYGGEHLDLSTASYLGSAFGFGKVSSVFSGSDWSQNEYEREADPVAKAPAALGKTSTVTSTWGTKSASCRVTTAISSFTLGVQADYSNGQTVASGGTFTVSRSSVVSGTSSSYSSKPLLFVVNSTNVYIKDDSSRSSEMIVWSDEFALKKKTEGDYEFDDKLNRVLFNPRSALGTYEFYLEKYPEKGFKIKLVN